MGLVFFFAAYFAPQNCNSYKKMQLVPKGNTHVSTMSSKPHIKDGEVGSQGEPKHFMPSDMLY